MQVQAAARGRQEGEADGQGGDRTGPRQGVLGPSHWVCLLLLTRPRRRQGPVYWEEAGKGRTVQVEDRSHCVPPKLAVTSWGQARP